MSKRDEWKQLIADRDRKVTRIQELQREVCAIDAELEKNPPPANVCVGVWVRKAKS